MNQAIDDGSVGFFNGDGKETIHKCFKGVLTQNTGNHDFMPVAFRQIVENVLGVHFEWPNNKRIGNAFKYLWEQYCTNVVNNLNTHCESRLRKFFKMKAYELNNMMQNEPDEQPVWYNGNDITNAVKWAYHRKDHTRGDQLAVQKRNELLNQLYGVGAPFMEGNEFNIREFTKNNWFQSMRMWMLIQRDIHRFHLEYAELNREWYRFKKSPLTEPEPVLPQPPEITNFTVVPTCTFQRRHIRIDTDALYNILCAIKEVPRKCGMTTKKGKVKMRNIELNEFLSNKTGSWSLFFDLDEINRQVKHKKPFAHKIMSDGVSVSILYHRPVQEAVLLDDEETRRKWLEGEFANELGIDPGMRTWNATVRYNFITGEEVIFEE